MKQYQLTDTGVIKRTLNDGSTLFIPPENNGTAPWIEYQAWLDEGNTPDPPPPEPPPGPDFLGFWDAILVSQVYQKIRTQAITNPAVLVACTEFVASFGDAKIGRPNIPAIQASIYYLITSGEFDQFDVDELQALLTNFHLDSLFTIPFA